MNKALATLKEEYFGNLSIKGIHEISLSSIDVSFLPQTWGWAILLILIVIYISFRIIRRVKRRKKLAPLYYHYKNIDKDSSLVDIYFILKMFYKSTTKKKVVRIDDQFLISNFKVFTSEEQDIVNRCVYEGLIDPDFYEVVSIRNKLLKEIRRLL